MGRLLSQCFWVSGFRMAGVDVRPGQALHMVLAYTFGHVLRPEPRLNGQSAALTVLYEDSAYFYSPYATLKQKTSVGLNRLYTVLSKACPLPHQLEAPRVSAALPSGTVQYSCGVYGARVEGYTRSSSPLKFHYALKETAFLTINSLHRELTVLPWFNVLHVHESYRMHHDGFGLAGDQFARAVFLRAVMERTETVQYLGAYPFVIPEAAYEVSVRDEVGCLTGAFTRAPSHQPGMHKYTVTPRYPLTGQWTYSFTLAYKLPLNHFLAADPHRLHTRRLAVPLMGLHFDTPVDAFRLRVNLPEDARILEYVYDHAEPAKITETVSRYKTYFSTAGELSLQLDMADLGREHAQTITLLYEYPWWGIFRKPLAIAFGLLFGLVLFKLAASADVSIAQKPRGTAEATREGLLRLFQQRRSAMANLGDVADIVGSPDGARRRTQLAAELDAISTQILAALRLLLDADASVSLYGATLKKLYEEHRSCVNALLASPAAKPADPAALARLERDATELDTRIVKWEAKLFAKAS